VDSDKSKYGENTNTCIVTISGNYSNIGIINNTNNEILRMLGYSPSEIIDQNVSRIMPKIYGEMHDNFLRRFLEEGD
jgi:PAS domain S-box-containing protein